MKIRNGFVSNSSSSSFICHTDLELDKIKEILKRYLEEHNIADVDNLKYGEVFDGPRYATDEDIECMKDWGIEITKDDKVLFSIYDNSIPYDILSRLEWDYDINAARYHMD